MKRSISFICAFLIMLTSVASCSKPETIKESTTTTQAETTEIVTTVETEPAVESYESRYKLSNPDADINAKKLYDYINDVYGTAIITGQQESTWMGSPDYEMDYIFEKTGKSPHLFKVYTSSISFSFTSHIEST